MTHPLLVKILNVLAYIFLLSANIYSGLEGDDGNSPYHDNHVTYISPAPFVFGVWGLIHFLLGGFVIYQFFSSANEIVVEGINWHFIGISLLNALWLALWEADYLILSWIVILFTSFEVSYVYLQLKQKYTAQHLADTIWIHAPFSLYHGWIFVIAVLNTFAAFTPDKTDEDASLLIRILVIIGLLVLKSVSVSYLELGSGDIAGSTVITWTLIGIFVEQQDPFIHWSALVLAIFSALHIIKAIAFFIRDRRRGEEGTSLLNNP